MSQATEDAAAPTVLPAPVPAADGVVKMFDAERGFGFVILRSVPGDVFLHISKLQEAGADTARQGDRLSCIVAHGQRGRYVERILRIEQAGGSGTGTPGVVHLTGTVKFYHAERGYGFVRAASGEDVFVGAKLLRRLRLLPLRDGQIVAVSAVPGARGLIAETLTFPSVRPVPPR